MIVKLGFDLTISLANTELTLQGSIFSIVRNFAFRNPVETKFILIWVTEFRVQNLKSMSPLVRCVNTEVLQRQSLGECWLK